MSGFCVSCGVPVTADELRCPACVPSTKDEIWPGPEAQPRPQAEEEALPAPKGRPSIVPALIILGVVCMLGVILVPNFLRARARGQTTACKSNLKNIGTALEMYSADNEGHFPLALGGLKPNYLKTIPKCPGLGEDSYSAGYFSVSKPADAYTVACSGENHHSVNYSANYPRYSSREGLLER